MTEGDPGGVAPPQNFAEAFERLRAGIYKAVEWLVRFAELVLLAAVFQYAADKTHNAELGLFAWLLGFGALFYVAEYFDFALGRFFKPGRRSWWRWAITIAAMALFVWFVVRTAGNITDVIKALETTQR